MYVEEFRVGGPLTEESAQELADLAGRFTSRITVSAGGHSVHAPVLPWCWETLRLRAGSPVSVTAHDGHRPADIEDRLALRAFVTGMRALTSPPGGHRLSR